MTFKKSFLKKLVFKKESRAEALRIFFWF